MAAFDAGSIESRLSVDRSEFTAALDQAKADADRFSKTPVQAKITADGTQAKATLDDLTARADKLSGKAGTIKIQADASQANTELDKTAAKAAGLTAKNPKVTVTADTAGANADLDKTALKADALGAKTEKIKVTTDTSQMAQGLRDAGALLDGFKAKAGASGKASGAAVGAGLLAGIGPGITGISAKMALISTGVTVGLAGLPALAGVAGVGIGTALVGGIAAMVSSGALSAVSPAVTAFQAAQNTTGKAAATAMAKYKADMAALTPVQQQLATSVNGMESAWQNFINANTAGVAKILGQGMGLLPGIFTQMSKVFQAAVPQIQAVIPVLGQVAHGFLSLAQVSVPAFAPLVGAVLNLVDNALPGIETVIKATMPFLGQFAGMLGSLGKNLGAFFADAAPALAASMKVLGELLGLVGGLLPVIMKLAGALAGALAPVFTQLAGVIKSLLPFLTLIGGLFASLASAVLTDLVAAFGALAQLLTAIAPALTVFAAALSSSFALLENAGVFAILGVALEALVPVIAKLIDSLVIGLAPAFPALISAASTLAGILVQLLAAGLGAVLTAAVPLAVALATGASALVTWLDKAGLLVPVMAGLLFAWKGWALAVDLAKGAMIGFQVAMALMNAEWSAAITLMGLDTIALKAMYAWDAIIAVATKAWAAAQAVLDVVMNASVIGLVVIAVAALAAGIYELVTHWATVWAAISGATRTAWDAIKGIFSDVIDWITGHWKLLVVILTGPVGAAALWIAAHWSGITHIFSDVIDWLSAHWKLILVILTGPVGLAALWLVHAWAGIHNDIDTAWNAIAAFFVSWWNAEVAKFTSAGRAIASVLSAGWNAVTSALKTAWNAIAAFFVSWWNNEVAYFRGPVAAIGNALKAAWSAIETAAKATWGAIASFFVSWWNSEVAAFRGPVAAIGNALKAAWDGIESAAKTVFGGILSFFGGFWAALKAGFADAVSGIQTAWQAIENVVKAPVDWVIRYVYDDLIMKFWNDVAGPVGLPTLPKLAEGGIVPGGYSRDDNQLVWMRSGEGVLQPGAVAKLGGKPFIDWVNATYGDVPVSASVPGRSYAGGGFHIPNPLPAIGHAIAGSYDQVAHAVKDVGGFFGGLVTDVKNGIYDGLAAAGAAIIGNAAKLIPGSSGVADAMRAYPLKLWDGFAAWVTGHGPGPAAAAGTPYKGKFGAGVAQWSGDVLKALAMLGLPASDLGLVLYQMQTESGGNPNAINLTDINAQQGDPSRGLLQTIGTTFAAYRNPSLSPNIYDPLANIYAALNYAVHGPGIGSRPGQLGGGSGYDEGGWLQPGMTMVMNATGRPEPVLNGDQWDALTSAAGGNSGILARLDKLIRTMEQVPAGVGYHVGGAINGAAAAASFRGRFPRN
jgi:phage-related protein